VEQVAYDPDGKLDTVRFQYLTTMLLNEMRKQYHRAEAEAEVITEQEDKIEAQQRQTESLQTQVQQQREELQQRVARLESLVKTPVTTSQPSSSPTQAQTSGGSQ
jgi:septal ring factor EnvC (AmiA/AmiB activator)